MLRDFEKRQTASILWGQSFGGGSRVSNILLEKVQTNWKMEEWAWRTYGRFVIWANFFYRPISLFTSSPSPPNVFSSACYKEIVRERTMTSFVEFLYIFYVNRLCFNYINLCCIIQSLFLFPEVLSVCYKDARITKCTVPFSFLFF